MEFNCVFLANSYEITAVTQFWEKLDPILLPMYNSIMPQALCPSNIFFVYLPPEFLPVSEPLTW